MPEQLKHDYTDLTPETILAAVESLGYETSGRQLALNSYENRVYRCGLEQGGAVIVKFYRPNRWSDLAIAEEHQFALELVAQEIPVVAPILKQGVSLFEQVTVFQSTLCAVAAGPTWRLVMT